MRFWVKPDQLAKLNITVGEVIQAIQSQNTVNPAGQIGGEPAPAGQEFTYSVRAQGRLTTPEEFGDIVVRANPDGSIVRLRDVARVELGAQVYNVMGRLNGKPAADHRDLPTARLQRPRRRQRRQEGHGAAQAALSRRTWTTRWRSTRRRPSPRACARSPTRSGRRCSWSSSSSSSSCRAGGRR